MRSVTQGMSTNFVTALRFVRRNRSSSYGIKRLVRRRGEIHDDFLFNVSPNAHNRAGLRVVEQALYLTKSIEAPMPAVYKQNFIKDQKSLETILECCNSSITSTRSFFADDKEERNIVLRERAKSESSAVKPFINIYRIISTHVHKWFSDYHKQCICFAVGISSHWKREKLEHPIQTSFRDGHIIYRKELLSPFWDFPEVESTKGNELTWDFLTSPSFHIWKKSNHLKRCDSGFGDDVPYSSPTTAVLSEYDGKPIENPVFKGILFAFTMAHSYALACGLVNDKGELRIPVPIQFVLIGAQSLQFVCFQLNTLDLHSNDGIKNLVWFKDTQLYDSAVLQEKLKKRSLSTHLENFNRADVDLLLKFLLNGLTRLL